jgi:hypothetical protein
MLKNRWIFISKSSADYVVAIQSIYLQFLQTPNNEFYNVIHVICKVKLVEVSETICTFLCFHFLHFVQKGINISDTRRKFIRLEMGHP